MIATTADAAGLCAFVDASPSPFHVCATVAQELVSAGYTELVEAQAWEDVSGAHFVVRGGSIIAWDARGGEPAFRIVGGHTDSPNLRLKQHPELRSAGLRMVGLEPYGGAWLNSWLDRDLGVSGRVSVRDQNSLRHMVVRIDDPVLRVPQLAIHLSEDRRGVSLDPQRHVNAVWGVDDGAPADFLEWLCGRIDVDRSDLLGWELMTHDLAPSSVIGAHGDLLSAPRLDNQGTCYAGLRALLDATGDGPTRVLALFDHEEVGSASDRGAASDFLITTLERIVLARNGDRADFLRTMAASACASGDMAHATHPNHPDRHEPAHPIEVNGGPVLKVNQNLRYASDAHGEGLFALAAAQADVPLQRYVHRADLPCGSTIGPITATRTGLTTVDVGAPQLAMHSARELMGATDITSYSAALQAFLNPAG
ncbi:M18 family aminopeptidase [Williamsia sp. CHRR-6]|uniref:M18 family aminopeptidase n=1 Tax=Williamsia sp. CHRR-6 TaxID=2835871 RepID=UPI001BDABAB3|nr:M18 family aminopeptidase [Williamsia sp. CHRR-6]MBT0568517.1 M18 family aminopeptidase [Williamsia sp. CHRR-6]